jgi:hypothetical protein
LGVKQRSAIIFLFVRSGLGGGGGGREADRQLERQACEGFYPYRCSLTRKAPVGPMLSFEEETYFWVTLAAVSAITYLARYRM